MKWAGYAQVKIFIFAHGTLYVCLVLSYTIALNFYRAGYLECGTFMCTTALWMIDNTLRLVVYKHIEFFSAHNFVQSIHIQILFYI